MFIIKVILFLTIGFGVLTLFSILVDNFKKNKNEKRN